jgi:short-subunit dehydrogenase
VVTGASSGIGRAFARALRARGERLVLVARRADRLQALADELGGESAALVLPLDLAAPGAAASLVATLHGRGVGIGTLVNCAGFGHAALFHEQPEERVLGMIDLDVRALVALTRAVLPEMVARGRGTVINVSSTAAFQPVPWLAVYAASKSFVLSFTEALVSELRGTGVRVQALCPGLTATEFQEVADTGPKRLGGRVPMMTAEEVVATSLRGLDAGKTRVVSGFSNRLVTALVPFVPTALSRAVAERLFRPDRTPAEAPGAPDQRKG